MLKLFFSLFSLFVSTFEVTRIWASSRLDTLFPTPKGPRDNSEVAQEKMSVSKFIGPLAPKPWCKPATRGLSKKQPPCSFCCHILAKSKQLLPSYDITITSTASIILYYYIILYYISRNEEEDEEDNTAIISLGRSLHSSFL